MIRKFNYTGRKRIPQKLVRIHKFSNGQTNYFTASLALQNLGFPEHARIYVEAYLAANFVRFPFGTVSRPVTPADSSLDDLPGTDDISFRVKVVDESSNMGRIIAQADNIRANNDIDSGQKESILPVKYANIKHQIWKVEFDQDFPGPVLIFNNEDNFPGIRTKMKDDPHFFSLIYPTAIRIVLSKIIEEGYLERDSDEWYSRWIQFTEDVLGVSPTPSKDSPEVDNWIDEVVNSFCLKHRVLNRLKP